jgi:hypothetical protein
VKRGLVLLCAVILPLGSVGPGAVAGTRAGRPVGHHLEVATGGGDGTVGVAAARAMHQGYAVPDQAAYERAKTAAAGNLGPRPTRAVPSAAAPTAALTWKGLASPGHSPSDSTGAIGTTRYIETVNTKVGIYDRAGALIASASLDSFWQEAGNNNFDPQVMWDARTNRFYYAGDSVASSVDNRLAFGFSKSASPNNASSDWCHYEVGYGSDFPDYPKLGDSRDFGLIGVNVFTGKTFTGSDIVAIGKPVGTGAIGTCPDPSTFKFGIGTDIKTANGTTAAFTPVPATEVDANGTGFVVARPAPLPATKLTIFTVTKNLDGTPHITTTGKDVPVPSYTVPPAAPQAGTTRTIDTLDSRPTQAVAAVDPSHSSAFALWTQHTVSGGAGAEVRWYEIEPTTATLLQSGKVTSSKLFSFNGAISPDRVVAGTTKAFGGNMVLGFNTSSSTTFPVIKMVSKLAGAAQSAPVKVKGSPGFDVDFGCPAATDVCRWGDYSSATPDPAAPTAATTGVVWLTNMWNRDGSSIDPTTGTAWQTWNWAAHP